MSAPDFDSIKHLIRLEVAEGNKQLSDAAAEAGVGSQMFGVFHDAGYLGQYTLDAENIRIYKGVPEGARFWTTWVTKNLQRISSGSHRRKGDFAGSKL